MLASVLITGAGGGIGMATAETFAKRRYNICLCGHSESKIYLLNEKAEELR